MLKQLCLLKHARSPLVFALTGEVIFMFTGEHYNCIDHFLDIVSRAKPKAWKWFLIDIPFVCTVSLLLPLPKI